MDLEGFLKENGVWYRMVPKRETVHTTDAADVTGIELRKVTKNLVSMTHNGEYVMLIVPGDKRINLKAAAGALNVRNVRLVPFDQAEAISGYPPGGTPSVGHKTRMKTIVDESLLEYKTVYCGGGSRDKLLELRVSDIIQLNDAIVARIARG